MDLYLSNVGFKHGFREDELEELCRLMTASPTARHIVTDTMLKPVHPNPVIPAGMEVFRQDRTLDPTNRHGGVAICVNGEYEPQYGLRGQIPNGEAEYLCVTCTVEGSPCVIISAYIMPIVNGIEGRHVLLTGTLRRLIQHYLGADLIVGGDFYFASPALHDAFMAMCAEYGLVEKIGGLTYYEHGGAQLVSKPDYLLVRRSDNYRPAVMSVFGDPIIYAEKLSDHVLVFVEWSGESISASQNFVAVASPRKGTVKKMFHCIRRDCEYSRESGFPGWASRQTRRSHATTHQGIPKKNMGPGAVVNPLSKHAKKKKRPCEHCSKLFRYDLLETHSKRCSKNPVRVTTKLREPRKCAYCRKMFTHLAHHEKICLFRQKPLSRSSSRPRSLPKQVVPRTPPKHPTKLITDHSFLRHSNFSKNSGLMSKKIPLPVLNHSNALSFVC